jgi:hypothetical protein
MGVPIVLPLLSEPALIANLANESAHYVDPSESTIHTTCFPMRVEMSAAASRLQHRATMNDVSMIFIFVRGLLTGSREVQDTVLASM